MNAALWSIDPGADGQAADPQVATIERAELPAAFDIRTGGGHSPWPASALALSFALILWIAWWQRRRWNSRSQTETESAPESYRAALEAAATAKGEQELRAACRKVLAATRRGIREGEGISATEESDQEIIAALAPETLERLGGSRLRVFLRSCEFAAFSESLPSGASQELLKLGEELRPWLFPTACGVDRNSTP